MVTVSSLRGTHGRNSEGEQMIYTSLYILVGWLLALRNDRRILGINCDSLAKIKVVENYKKYRVVATFVFIFIWPIRVVVALLEASLGDPE